MAHASKNVPMGRQAFAVSVCAFLAMHSLRMADTVDTLGQTDAAMASTNAEMAEVTTVLMEEENRADEVAHPGGPPSIPTDKELKCDDLIETDPMHMSNDYNGCNEYGDRLTWLVNLIPGCEHSNYYCEKTDSENRNLFKCENGASASDNCQTCLATFFAQNGGQSSAVKIFTHDSPYLVYFDCNGGNIDTLNHAVHNPRCIKDTAFDGPHTWKGFGCTLDQCRQGCTGDCKGFNWWPSRGGCRHHEGGYTTRVSKEPAVSGAPDCIPGPEVSGTPETGADPSTCGASSMAEMPGEAAALLDEQKDSSKE